VCMLMAMAGQVDATEHENSSDVLSPGVECGVQPSADGSRTSTTLRGKNCMTAAAAVTSAVSRIGLRAASRAAGHGNQGLIGCIHKVKVEHLGEGHTINMQLAVTTT
jgi:hypothetical protein